MTANVLILESDETASGIEQVLSLDGLRPYRLHSVPKQPENLTGLPADVIIINENIIKSAGTPASRIIHTLVPHMYIVFARPDAPVSPPPLLRSRNTQGVPFPPLIHKVRSAVIALFSGKNSNTGESYSKIIKKFNITFPNSVSEKTFKCYFN